MKTLLYIYLGISVLTNILYALSTLKISHEFRRRYPNIKAPKSHLTDKIFVIFKGVLIHFIPIFNIWLLFVYLFCDEKLVERTIEKMYLKLSKEASE
jgi:hypothetical protein